VIHPSPDNFANKYKFVRGPIEVETVGLRRIKIQTDLVIWAATWAVSNGMYPSKWLNSAGELNVKDSFLVSAATKGNVFGFGDVCSIAETKQAITLPKKVVYIRKNILSIVKALQTGEPATSAKLTNYGWTDKVVLFLPFGPVRGLSLGQKTFTDKETSKWKGRDLYTEYFWKLLTGNPPPALPVDDKCGGGVRDNGMFFPRWI
jgi:hypothetical protein